MARRDFVALQRVPDGTSDDMLRFLNAVKEDLELLMRMRGDPNNSAVVRGDVSTDYPVAVNATAASIGGMTAIQAVVAINSMLGTISADLNNLRTTLNNLMVNLKT